MRIKNPAKLYYGIAILSFIISGYFSVLLFQSSATTLTEAIPMIAIAIILELAKFSLLRELSNSNHVAWLKVSFCSLWMIITLSSIVASAGYVINQTNKTTNESIKMSDSYKIKMASRDNQRDLYSVKKSELDKLHVAKENALKDLQTQREALPKNYISKKVEMGVRMNQVEQDYNNRISKISSELSTISSSLSQEMDLSSTQVNATNGYTAIFQLSADLYNKNATEKVTASGLELWFFLALGVVLELVANVFAYLSMVTGKVRQEKFEPKIVRDTAPPKVETPKESFKPKKEVVIAGFRPEIKPTIDSKLKEKFYNALKESAEKKGNNKADGYVKIANDINIRREDARTLRKELEREGRIAKVGNRTVIL